MNLSGIHDSERAKQKMHTDINNYYLANGKAKTIKHISRTYGISIQRAVGLLRRAV